MLLAEAMSCQLEYKYLAHLTGRRKYFDHVRASAVFELVKPHCSTFYLPSQVERLMDLMLNAEVQEGMLPTKWIPSTGKPSNSMFFADLSPE